MMRPNIVRARIVIALLFVMMSPLAHSAWAQTPDAPIEPPVVTEVPTEVPPVQPTQVPPPPTEVPPPPVVTEAPPVETEVPPVETEVPPAETEIVPPVEPTETEVPVETPTETVVLTEAVQTPTAEPTQTEAATPTPTPTEEIIEPDHLVLVSGSVISIGPGQTQDITLRYTLGSDRIKTEITVDLTGPAGESLEGWSIAPVGRGDSLEDPTDPNRMYKARIDESGAIKRENTFDTTWRLTAPAHIEKPIIVSLNVSSKNHRDDGVTDGPNVPTIVTANAVASVHTPTLNCDVVAGEGITNTWNCAFDTTHPDPDVAINVSAAVPAGWELKLNSGSNLTDVPVALDAAVVTAEAFTLSADYPIGCPDAGATSTATVSLVLTYPSGEVATLTQDLALTFERPNPSLTVSSFEFNEFNILESLTATGTLRLAYSDAPCAWDASIQLNDLHSDTFTVSDAVISITGTEAQPGASITIADGMISIQAPESANDTSSGEITIHLQINLPHLIPPGSYVIGVVTEIKLRDEI